MLASAVGGCGAPVGFEAADAVSGSGGTSAAAESLGALGVPGLSLSGPLHADSATQTAMAKPGCFIVAFRSRVTSGPHKGR